MKSILKNGTSANAARVGLSAAVALAAVGALATSGQAVTTTQQTVTLSASTGPSAGTNTVTLSLASTASPKFGSGATGVQFQNATSTTQSTTACATNPSTGASSAQVTVTSLRYLSTTKVSVVVPDLSTGTTGFWIVCAYNAAVSSGTISSSATVIGKGLYTVAAAPTITSISPSSGPAYGGQTVTIVGTNFPTTIAAATPLTATLGGDPLTSITAVSATQFTAVTPSHPTGAVALNVTTAGGSVQTNSAFTYVNGMTVSPSTVVSGQSVDVDIQGSGFNALTFNATDTAGLSSGNGTAVGTNTAGPHVYLVQGTYNQASYAAGVNKTLGQKAECVNPAVISDNELICTVDAAHSITTASAGTYVYSGTSLANGTYTVTVVDSGSATAPTYQTVLSSGATFTVANF